MNEARVAKRQVLEKLSEQVVTVLFVDSVNEVNRSSKGYFLLEPEIQEELLKSEIHRVKKLEETVNYIHFIDGQIYEVHIDSISGIYAYKGFNGGQIKINEPLMKVLQRGEDDRS